MKIKMYEILKVCVKTYISRMYFFNTTSEYYITFLVKLIHIMNKVGDSL